MFRQVASSADFVEVWGMDVVSNSNPSDRKEYAVYIVYTVVTSGKKTTCFQILIRNFIPIRIRCKMIIACYVKYYGECFADCT